MALQILRGVLRILQTLLEIIYIPVSITRFFKKSKKCPPIENKILLLSASEIARRIRKKENTSFEVVEAYISRIKEVNPFINAVVDERFEEALQDAQATDNFIKTTSLSLEEIEQKYPLLGVPITIKGSIALTGLLHSAGRVDHQVKATSDAVIVRYVKEAGAIPLLVSNVPELCLNWETMNKLTGTTSNPYNTTRSPGGSSGGEASLIGCAASLIGLGTDVGGSLRLPAHCCGIFGHKPTPSTVSSRGHYPDCRDIENWEKIFTMGPMTRYADDLKLLFKVIIEPGKADILKLDQKVNVKQIKIFYTGDPKAVIATRFSRDVVATVQKVVSFFDTFCETQSQKVDLPSMKYCPELSYLSMLHIKDVDNVFDNKNVNYFFEMLKLLLGQSQHSFNAILFEILIRVVPKLFKNDMENIYNLLDELRNDFMKILGDDGVFIFPTSPCEATYHGDIWRKSMNASYLSIFNALGFPVTACPVILSSNGLPIGIQIVAAPYMDRLCLSVAKEIETAFGGWRFDQ